MIEQYNLSLKTATIFVFLFCMVPVALTAQTTSIPDPNFEQALIDLGIDTDGAVNGEVLTSDVETVETLIIKYKNIYDLTGIEDFSGLEELDITGNPVTVLNTYGNSELTLLVCNSNPLISIDLSTNFLLENLEIRVRPLNSIDLSHNVNLKTLDVMSSGFDFIDISNNINLKNLYLGGSDITEIDLSNNTLLEYLDVAGVHLSALDVSNNILLRELYCGNYGGDFGQVITTIDISNNVNLEIFYAENLFIFGIPECQERQ